MPTTLNQMTATTISATARTGAPSAGLVQWLFAIGLMALPFAIVLASFGFLFSFYKDKSMKQVIQLFKKNGDVDTFEIPKDESEFKRGKGTYLMVAGRTQHLMRHWLFGFRRPVHFFREGMSSELQVTTKIYPGNENSNSEYLQAYCDSKKAQDIFKQDKDVFTLVLVGIAGISVGALVMLVWTTQSAKAQPAAGTPVKK